ncbi:hypothetical protein JXM67_09310 [candidate division WOR-3 bacterium]|nr:hypothetical protein [candidate division WOR-3 bacterium]
MNGQTASNPDRNRILKAVLLFFLAYMFGALFHDIIHEFGHAITIWVQGGTITGFYFHPFDSSYNFSSAVGNHMFLYAGGAFIGLPLTIIFMGIALRYRSPLMFPLITAGVYGFISTGVWMIKAVTTPGIATDYTYMIGLGFPAFVFPIIGVIYIAFGMLARIFFLPLVGIDYETRYGARFTVYLAGIIPWFIIHWVYNMVFHGYPELSFVNLVIPVIVYTALETLISLPLQRKVKLFKRIPVQQVKLRHFLIIGAGIVILYAVVILVNAFFSGTPQ